MDEASASDPATGWRPLEAATTLVKDRLELLGLLRVVPLITCGALAFVMLATSLLPAATALAVAWLVQRVVQASTVQLSLATVAWPLGLVGLLLTLDQVSQSLLVPFRDWTASRVNGEVRSSIRRAVSVRPGIEHLESQVVRDAAALPVENQYLFNLGAGAEGQLWLLCRFAGGIVAALVVARFSLLAAVSTFVFVVWQRSLLRRHYAKAIASGMVDTTSDGRAAAYWSEILGAAAASKELRLFGFKDWAIERFTTHGQVPVDELSRVLLTAHRLHFQVFVLNALASLVPFLLLGRMALNGDLDAVELTAALGGVVAVFRVIAWMGWEAFSIEASVPQLSAVAALNEYHDQEVAAAAQRAETAQEHAVPLIEFDDVSFAYPDTDAPVLEHLNLVLRPGESVALVGENGAGKTTVLKLLAGFYRPTAGRILIDGQDLAALDLKRWRRRLAVIFQDFTRFELSAIDNVTLAAPQHPEARAHADAAAIAASADRIVQELPAGWDTVLSRAFTGGVDLSGGQWQRIALARALYGARVGGQVLVLDEPTASLDVAAEVALFDQLLEQASGCTAIVVSHRFSTVRRADRIVVLADGRVIEDGSHEILHGQGGIYARLYDLQAQRFHDDAVVLTTDGEALPQ